MPLNDWYSISYSLALFFGLRVISGFEIFSFEISIFESSTGLLFKCLEVLFPLTIIVTTIMKEIIIIEVTIIVDFLLIFLCYSIKFLRGFL